MARTNVTKESWIVTTTRKNPIAIGDLPFAPAVEKGKQVNLLRYHSYSEIAQSTQLPILLRSGWLALSKRRVKSKNIRRSEAETAVHRIEEDELTDKVNELSEDIDNIPITSTGIYSVSSATYNVNLVEGEIIKVLLCDASNNKITVNLPNAEDSSDLIMYIKKVDSSTNVVTIDANSNETVDGDFTQIISQQYNSITVVSDDNNWWIL